MSEGFVPLSLTLPFWPSDAFGEATFLDHIGVREFTLREADGALSMAGILVWLQEIAVRIPGLQGVELVLLAGSEGMTAIPFDVNLLPDFAVAFPNIGFTLRFSNDALRPVQLRGGVWERIRRPDGSPAPAEVELNGVGVKVGLESGIEVLMPAGAPALTLGAVMLGETGIVLEVNGLRLHLSQEQVPPQGMQAGFQGVAIDSVRLHFPPELDVPLDVRELDFEGLVIGTGGFSGLIRGTWMPHARFNESTQQFEGAGAGNFLDLAFALHTLNLRFIQNIPSQAGLSGELFLPFFERPIGIGASVGSDGSFLISLTGTTREDDESGTLTNITLAGLLSFDVNSLTFERAEDVFILALAGKIQPLLAGLDWPAFALRRLAVNSRGEVDIDGGWIELPEIFTIDLNGFKIDIDEIGLGSEDDTDRQWFGFSGGIRLIEGIPLSASVEGLRISWNPASPPTSAEPMRGVEVTLKGIAVALEVPGTLKLEGSVEYETVRRPPETRRIAADAPSAPGLFGYSFTGSVSLEIIPLHFEIGAELLIGNLTPYRYEPVGDGESERLVTGEPFTALFIVMSVDLPTAVPLGATGAGLYGLKGLFGMHVAPDRHLDSEGEPESWYGWYKAERGNHSERNVTKVIKWGPRREHFAFGAGLTLGTVYDDGFTINAALLAAVLIPGPVIMIEGRANLLKPRGGQGVEGALYMLIVLDGIAETFQINIDVNLTLEDVITVGGGLEAFFDFRGERWYIYVGRKDPIEKRIRAEVLSIITATAYFMIDPSAIIFGATAGVDLQEQWGPLEIKLILRIAFEIGLFFKQPQLTGMVELYGEITVRIFGIGISLILQCLLEGSAPQPWWIHGLARVALSLPFPLPSFDLKVEFTWGQSGLPAVVDLIKGASMIHPKHTSAAWVLSEDGDERTWPLVPIDAVPVLSLAKPLSGISTEIGEDGRNHIFTHEVTEGVEFGYALRSLVLEERNPANGGWRVRPVPAPASSNLWLRPDRSAREPQAALWWYSPLDTYDRTSRANYVNPCANLEPEVHCLDWGDVPEGTVFRAPFARGGLVLTPGFNAPGFVLSVRPTSPGTPDRGLALHELTVRFPEPVAWVAIRWAMRDAVFSAYHAGRAIRIPARASTPWRHEPLGALGATTPGLKMDTLRMVAARGAVEDATDMVVTSICWVTMRELDAHPARLEGGERSTMRSEPLLAPHRSYRLRVTASRSQRRVGDTAAPDEAVQEKIYGFRTGGLPGTDYARLEEAPPDFADTPPNRFGSYVRQTAPSNGAPAFYRGYDTVVELDEPYAASMLAPSLTIRVVDRNGKVLAGTPPPILLTGNLPFWTPGLMTLLKAPRHENCAATPVPWTPQQLMRLIVCPLPAATPPERLIRVELGLRLSYGNQSVYGFEFATSRFRDASEHLGSGLRSPTVAADGVLRGDSEVRALVGGAAPPLDWRAELTELLARRLSLRDVMGAALQFGPHDVGMSVQEAIDAIAEADAALDARCGEIYDLIDRDVLPLFVARGMGHRPLPPAVEVVSIDTLSGGRFFLVESPEPIDWTRITVLRGGESVPVVWSADRTRAFLFAPEASGLFAAGAQNLRFSYLRGGETAPDLMPLYRRGRIDRAAEEVEWRIA